jgi:hypothetical protein
MVHIIHLTTFSGGHPIYVNADHIVTISQSPRGSGTRVELSDRESALIVAEPPNSVAAACKQ